jgi:hypothetical protein
MFLRAENICGQDLNVAAPRTVFLLSDRHDFRKVLMSALGQKQIFRDVRVMSALEAAPAKILTIGQRPLPPLRGFDYWSKTAC